MFVKVIVIGFRNFFIYNYLANVCNNRKRLRLLFCIFQALVLFVWFDNTLFRFYDWFIKISYNIISYLRLFGQIHFCNVNFFNYLRELSEIISSEITSTTILLIFITGNFSLFFLLFSIIWGHHNSFRMIDTKFKIIVWRMIFFNTRVGETQL